MGLGLGGASPISAVGCCCRRGRAMSRTPLGWRGAGAVERGGLENRCPLYGGPRVRIPPSPPHHHKNQLFKYDFMTQTIQCTCRKNPTASEQEASLLLVPGALDLMLITSSSEVQILSPQPNYQRQSKEYHKRPRPPRSRVFSYPTGVRKTSVLECPFLSAKVRKYRPHRCTRFVICSAAMRHGSDGH